MRVALYARFSTDLQKQTSIADQLRAARARALAEGWPVTVEHADEGISGSIPVALRAGGKALLADALAGRFDVLIVEGLDRLSRDVGEQDQVVKRLEYRGIRMIGTSDGYDTQAKGRKVMRIARGLVNELYLDDLRDKTHRGLAGQFERGLSAGGRSYGYRTEAHAGGRAMVVDEAEAAIVRRVFERYVAGDSVRTIVHALNADGVPSARGGTWAVSALYGSGRQGLGMLRNELYTGRVWWNRRQWIKDPDTGKRRYVERPREEWQERMQQELRIVPEALWGAARARERTHAPLGTRAGKGASPRTLFGGLLQCPACGGPMVAVDARRYGCNQFKDRGPAACSNRDGFPRERVDRQLIAAVREELLAPVALAEVRAHVRGMLVSASAGAAAGGAEARARLREVEGEIGRLVDAVASVGLSAALRERLAAAEREREELTVRAAASAPGAARVTVDEIIAAYRRQMLLLEEALKAGDDLGRTRALLAQMLGAVRLVREGEAMFAEFEEPAERLLLTAAGGGTPMGLVARAGFEPATFGL